jgi:hypothetical protein
MVLVMSDSMVGMICSVFRFLWKASDAYGILLF